MLPSRIRPTCAVMQMRDDLDRHVVPYWGPDQRVGPTGPRATENAPEDGARQGSGLPTHGSLPRGAGCVVWTAPYHTGWAS